MASILVVDDDDVERAGRTVVLAERGHEVVARSWGELATDGIVLADGPDLAVVVVRRDLDRWDRYQALRSAGHLPDRIGGATRVVAALDGGGAVDPVVALRLAAAGVHEVVALRHVRGTAELAALAHGDRRGTSPSPAPEELAWCQIGPRSNPSRVVDRVLELAEDDPSYLRAFEPGVQQNECGLSRRRAHTLRVTVAELGDLRPAAGRFTGGPVRDQSLPRWSEVVRFVNRCRGWDPDDDALRSPAAPSPRFEVCRPRW